MTVAEVLQKSADVMSKGGYTYELDLDISYAFTEQGVQTTIPMGYHFGWKETGQPPDVHYKGNVYIDDQSWTTEEYWVGNESYIQMNGAGWKKEQRMQSVGEEKGVSDGLAMMAKLFRGGPANGVTMKKEANTYVLEFDLQALMSNQSYKHYIQDHQKNNMDNVQEKLPDGVQLEKMQFHNRCRHIPFSGRETGL